MSVQYRLPGTLVRRRNSLRLEHVYRWSRLTFQLDEIVGSWCKSEPVMIVGVGDSFGVSRWYLVVAPTCVGWVCMNLDDLVDVHGEVME